MWELGESHQKVSDFFEINGWKWPKEKRYQQVIEEVGEYIQELLSGEEVQQREELWDIAFTYLGYIDSWWEESREDRIAILLYIVRTLQTIDCNKRDRILLFLAQFTKENKIFRKRDKDPSRAIQGEYTELESKKRQYLNVVLLMLLSRSYETTVWDLVDNSISKFNKRKW